MNRKYPLPTVVNNPEQFPSEFDKANDKLAKELKSNACYDRQKKIIAMNKENPNSEELKKEVQAQLKPMPVCQVLSELDKRISQE